MQHTIEKSVSIEGRGLHTGKPAKLNFFPCEANSGIFFSRIDLPGKPIIPASLAHVKKTNRGTTLGISESSVHTVEHLLSAIYGLGIDNLRIEIDGEEPPACDGSALPYAETLQKAGRKQLSEPRKICRANQTFWLEEKDKLLAYIPSDKLEITFTIDYTPDPIPRKTRHIVVNEETFLKEIAFARTFGFFHEYEALKANQLALGGNLENAVVIENDGKIMNPEGLRHPDEFVLHKILDLIGDIALTGKRILGHFVAHRTGHSQNVKFARMVCENIKLTEERKTQTMMNIEEIKAVLPHRYPFLLIDKILSLDPGKSAIGIKNVTNNEEFFTGHFPGKQVMPGVLIVEAMAQVAGVLFLSQPEHKGKLPFFVGIDKVRFRKPVVPGDRLEFSVKVLKVRGNTGKVEVEAKVDSDLVAAGELMFTIL